MVFSALWKKGIELLLSMTTAPVRSFFRLISKTDPRKVVFTSITGKYSCNPKYITEEMISRKTGKKIIWLYHEAADRGGFPPEVIPVREGTLRAAAEVYSARLWIENGVVFSKRYERKPDQIHIQTMHGSLGIKALDNAILSRQRHFQGRKEIRRESTLTNYVITDSAFEEGVFREVFWKNTPMVRLGHARTDILFTTDEKVKEEIRGRLEKEYGIPRDAGLILYAPTHRADFEPDIDLKGLAEAASERFGRPFCVMLRFHPSQPRKNSWKKMGGVVFDVFSYPDIQELMTVTDIGVTDYSSWIYDYFLTGRPGLLYVSDVDRYVKRTKLCYPLEATPFPVCRDNGALKQAVLDFDETKYREKCRAFIEEKEAVDDGKSAGRIVDWIETL